MIEKVMSLGSLRRFYHFSGQILPWCLSLSLFTLLYGTIAGLFLAPPDYQQGDCFRIIYVHVPCAMLSIGIYGAMAFFSAVFLTWHVKIADILAYSLAPIGALTTFCALITGSLWGKPMWGTWWIWDARLTSELILLFLYLGYMALYSAIPKAQSRAKASAVLAIVGAIDLPVIHYSVYWWSTLHQGSTLIKLKPTICSSMLTPLLSMIVGLGLLVITLLCLAAQREILTREAQNRWVNALCSR